MNSEDNLYNGLQSDSNKFATGEINWLSKCCGLTKFDVVEH